MARKQARAWSRTKSESAMNNPEIFCVMHDDAAQDLFRIIISLGFYCIQCDTDYGSLLHCAAHPFSIVLVPAQLLINNNIFTDEFIQCNHSESLCIAYGDPGLFKDIHPDNMARLYDVLPAPSEKARVQLCLARACETANLRAEHKSYANETADIYDLLISAESKFHALIEQLPNGIVLVDTRGTIIKWNHAMERISGVPREETLGCSIRDVRYRLYADKQLCDALSEHFDASSIEYFGKQSIFNEKITNEIRIVRSDGTFRTLESSICYLKLDESYMACSILRDITQKKELETQLAESEEKFRGIAEQLSDTIFITDTDGILTYVSPSSHTLFGLPPEEAVGRHFIEFLHSDAAVMAQPKFNTMVESGSSQETIVLLMKRADEGAFYGELAVKVQKKDECIIGTIGLIRDITQRKNVENSLKQLVSEKEILMRELVHRVKNNMNVINSLLGIQSRVFDDPRILAVFRECRDRVITMMNLQEMIYKTGEFTHVNLSTYLRGIALNLLKSYVMTPGKISLRLDLNEATIDLRRAIPCGLIVNELITNSLKYAFPNDMDGVISLGLSSESADESGGSIKYTITVGDDGIGMTKDFDCKNSDNIGLKIVSMMVQQLRGTIERKTGAPAEYVITF